MNWLSNIRVVLVGSQEPMNVGAAARAMQNFGISDLWLVAPEPRVREDLALHPEGSMLTDWRYTPKRFWITSRWWIPCLKP